MAAAWVDVFGFYPEGRCVCTVLARRPNPRSFSSSGSYRPYPTAAPPPHARQPAEEDRAPKLHKCPRCRKEYLSTINQRRCISSHLRGGGSAPRGGSIPGEEFKSLRRLWGSSMQRPGLRHGWATPAGCC